MSPAIPLPPPDEVSDSVAEPVHRRPGLPLGSWSFWVGHVAFWAVAFAAVMIIAVGFGSAGGPPAWFVGTRVAFGFIFTALLRLTFKQEAFLRRLGISRIGLMVGGPILGAVIMSIVMPGVEAVVGSWFDVPVESITSLSAGGSRRLGLSARFLLDITMLAAWCVAYFGLQLLRDQQATEMRLLEAQSLAYRNELRHLQTQISPHFLFNALNTIVASKEDPEAIDAITQSLAKYLRFLLAPCGVLEPLGREIDAIEQYLTIQSFRFGDRLSCRVDCDTDVRRIPVLPVMIQPLVENSLKYGTTDGELSLQVTIKAWRSGERLFIEVANTGRWATETAADSTGTGIKNLRRRLLLHAGPGATVTTREEDGWVRSTITIPLESRYASRRGNQPAENLSMEAVR